MAPKTGTSSIGLALPTLSRSVEEAEVLRGALESLAKLGWPIAVADGGSHRELLDYLEANRAIQVSHVAPGPGSSLVRQIKAAVRTAAARAPDLIVYCEPDKKWFFENRLVEMIDFAEDHVQGGIVFASREAGSFHTFPASQRLTESLTNQLIGELCGCQADYLYGPMALAPALVPDLAGMPDDLGWGWRIFAMLAAHHRGLPLTPFTSYLPCPEHQRGEESEQTRIYRLQQMIQNVRGAVAALTK